MAKVLTRDRRSSSEALMTALKTVHEACSQRSFFPPMPSPGLPASAGSPTFRSYKVSFAFQESIFAVTGLTCRSSIGDDDDQERLPQLPRPSRVQEHRLQDLLVERGSERGQAAESDLGDDLGGLSFRGDVVALYVSRFDRLCQSVLFPVT